MHLGRFFAPPKVYEEASPAVVPLSAEIEPAADIQMDVSQDAFGVAEPGERSTSYNAPVENADDGWASWGTAPVVPDDPYAKRLAISEQKEDVPVSRPPVFTASESRPPATYAQRSSLVDPVAPHPPLHTDNFESKSISPRPFLSPNAGRPNHDALPTFPATAHPSYSSPQPQVPSSQQPPTIASSSNVSIEEAQAKARAIAARLASLSKFAPLSSIPNTATPPFMPSPAALPPIPGIDEPIPGLGMPSASSPLISPMQAQPKEAIKPENFAKSLMAKYGWEKGQGLGATSQGMLNPLALSGSSDASKKKKAKGKEQQQQQPAPQQQRLQGSNKVIGMATAKGRVISDMKSEKDRQEREKYGEPSRVVCLSNMVGRDDVDEELVSDVSAEARKLGVLEECFVHIMPSYVPDNDSVRVFVIYSGLVGAWKAVKEFDGRFFGGRTVKAKFYDEIAYQTGTLHL